MRRMRIKILMLSPLWQCPASGFNTLREE